MLSACNGMVSALASGGVWRTDEYGHNSSSASNSESSCDNFDPLQAFTAGTAATRRHMYLKRSSKGGTHFCWARFKGVAGHDHTTHGNCAGDEWI
eukprot:3623701-Amphidinium_carterae.3